MVAGLGRTAVWAVSSYPAIRMSDRVRAPSPVDGRVGETRLCPVWSCTNVLPCPHHPTVPEELPRRDDRAGLASVVLLAALDAVARKQLDPTSSTVAVGVARHPVLGRLDQQQVLTVIQDTAGDLDVEERELIASTLEGAGHERTASELWLAQIVDVLTGPGPDIGLWVDERDEPDLRFERTAEGKRFPTVLRSEKSPMVARQRRLMALFEARPAEEEPWNWVLDHGAGHEQPAFLDEHGRREGINRHQVDADAREVKRWLAASGRDGSLTPLLVAIRDGGDWRREAKRVKGLRKRQGLPPRFRKAVLQGK